MDITTHLNAIQSSVNHLPKNKAGCLVATFNGVSPLPCGTAVIPVSSEAAGRQFCQGKDGAIWHVVVTPSREVQARLLQEVA